MLEDSGAVLVFAETDAHADKIEQLRDELPALRKVLRIDGLGPTCARRAGRGGQAVDADGARRPGGRHQVRRPGDADLHLGHDRQAQGLPADALQPALRDPRRQGVLPDALAKGESCWCSCRWRTCWPAR